MSQSGGSAGRGECKEGNRNHAQTGHEGSQDHRQRGKSSRFLQLDSCLNSVAQAYVVIVLISMQLTHSIITAACLMCLTSQI